MKTSSCKAKGRRLQQLIRDDLRQIGATFGLVDGDLESRGMGQNGVDVILSPAAERLMPLAIEAKNVEKLNVVGIFLEHFNKYKEAKSLKLLIHSRNHTEPMVTLRWSDFLNVFKRVVGTEEWKQGL